MHNRDMIWGSNDGRKMKIRDINSTHLTNILSHIDKNIDTFNQRYGKTRIDECVYNISQELRLRKLNRLDMSNNEENLF